VVKKNNRQSVNAQETTKLLILFLGLGLVFGLILIFPNKSQQNNNEIKLTNQIVNKRFELDSSTGRITLTPPPQSLHPNSFTQRKIPFKKNQSLTPTITSTTTLIRQSNQDDEEWGIAKQVSTHSWTMKIVLDDKMATPQEILEALNNYRRQHQREALTWDNNLANFAQKRAAYFTYIGKTDEHSGFIDYTNNIENVKTLGFWSLGENSSYGYRMEGVHLIEWVYAADEGHNNNQLDSNWTHVGIGVDGNQTDILFGGDRM